MESVLRQIKTFLSAPSENKNALLESDALVWIDWREYDENILEYFNEKLPDNPKIDYEFTDSQSKRGFDIILKKHGQRTPIPYAEDGADRDTTIISAQEYLSPTYQIRLYTETLGSDTLAFGVLYAAQWEQLEQELGIDKIRYYFAPVQADSKMFRSNI